MWDSDSIEDREDHVTSNIFAAVDRDREGGDRPTGASDMKRKAKKKDVKKKKKMKKVSKKKSKKKSTSDSSSTSSKSNDSSGSSSSDPWCESWPHHSATVFPKQLTLQNANCQNDNIFDGWFLA